MNQNIDVFSVAELWAKCFADKPDDLMETALKMILLDAQYWPTVKDISDAITELTTISYESAVYKQLDHNPRSRLTSSVVKEILDMVKSGKSKEYLAQIDISEIREYARRKFPDISDNLIRKNYNELVTALESIERCRGCKWTMGNCDTAGFYVVPVIDSTGWIRTEYKMCGKHSLAKKGRVV